MDRAFSDAQRKVAAFRKSVDSLTNISLTADVSAFNSALDSASRKAEEVRRNIAGIFSSIRADAANGADFRVKAVLSGFTGISDILSSIRSDAANGASFRVEADTSDLTAASTRVDAWSRDISDTSPTIDLDVDFSQLNAGISAAGVFQRAIEAVDPKLRVSVDLDELAAATIEIEAFEAAVGSKSMSVVVHFDVDGIPTTTAAMKTVDDYAREMHAEWSRSVVIHIESSGAAGTLVSLARIEVAASGLDGRNVNININVNAAAATAALLGFNAAAASTTTMQSVLGASFAFGAAAVAILTAALILAMASVVPLLGALVTLAATGAGVAAGFGLMAGAVYVLTSGLYDGGVAFDALAAKASVVHDAFVQALGPASLIVAAIGQAAMDVALHYMPMLGPVATATATEIQYVFQQLFDYLNSSAGESLMLPLLANINDMMGPLAAAAANFGIALLAMIQPALPYAEMLALKIEDIFHGLASWATSAEGASQITAAIELAIPFFSSLWSLVTSVGGALLEFSMVAGSGLPTMLDVLSTAITGLIDGLTWLYETVGGAGVAFGLLALAITPIVAAGILASGAVAAFISAAWPVAAVAAAIAVAATLIYDNWSTIGPFFESLWGGISTAAEAAWPVIVAGAQTAKDDLLAAYAPLQPAFDAVWQGMGPAASSALEGVQSAVTSIWGSVVAWWTANQDTIVAGAQAAWGMLMTVIGGAVQLVVALITPIWDSLVAWWESTNGSFGQTAQAAWTVISTIVGTAIQVVYTVVSTVLGLIAALWSANWDSIVQVVSGFGQIVGGVLQIALSLITGIIQVALGILTGDWDLAWQGLVTVVSGVWAGIQSVLSGALAIVTGIIQIFLTTMSGIWSAAWGALSAVVTTVFTAILTFFTTIGTGIITALTTAFAAILAAVLPIVTPIVTGIIAAFMGIVTFITTLGTTILTALSTAFMAIATVVVPIIVIGVALIVGIFVLLVQGIMAVQAQITALLVAGFTLVWGQISPVITAGIAMVVAVFQGLVAGVQAVWDAISAAASAAWTAISGVVTPIVTSIYDWIVEKWTGISTSTTDTFNAVSEFLSSTWDSIYQTVSGWLTSIYDWVVVQWDAVSVKTTEVFTAVSTYLSETWSAIYLAVSDWLTQIYNWLVAQWDAISLYTSEIFDPLLTYLSDTWSSIYTAVSEWLTSIYDWLVEQWDAISLYTTEIFDEVWTYLSDTWNSIYEEVSSIMDTIVEYVSTSWDALIEGVSTFASGFLESVTTAFWDAVKVGGDAIASLLEAIGKAAISTGIEVVVSAGNKLTEAGAGIRSITGAAEGGTTVDGFRRGGVAFADGGCACDEIETGAFARGGMGTQANQPRMHLWNEQKGNEAFIAERGPRNKQLAYLETAASWFGQTIAPKHKSHVRKGRFASGGIASPGIAAFEAGGYLGATHYNWSPEVAQIVSQMSGMTGGCGTPNTYSGHDYIGLGDDGANSVDWWGGGRGGQLDIACGNSLQAAGRTFPSLTYDIWQGEHSTLGYWGDHYDHLHETFGGAGGGGGGIICTALKSIFEAAVKPLVAAAKSATGAIDFPLVKDMAGGYIDDTVQKMIDWLVTQIPGCSGSAGGAGGDCAAAIPAAVEQLGVSPEYLTSMMSLGMGESGMDMGAVNNYDSNAAAGTPSTGCWQMIPSTFQAYAEPDCMDPNDALCQAMSSINYQEAVHGGPVSSPGYAQGGITSISDRPTLPLFQRGGVVPGSGPLLSLLHGGERVLTAPQNASLEALATNPATSGASGGSGAGGGYTDASQTNVYVEVNVEGGMGSSEADMREASKRIAEETGSQVVSVLQRMHSGTGAKKVGVARGFS